MEILDTTQLRKSETSKSSDIQSKQLVKLKAGIRTSDQTSCSWAKIAKWLRQTVYSKRFQKTHTAMYCNFKAWLPLDKHLMATNKSPSWTWSCAYIENRSLISLPLCYNKLSSLTATRHGFKLQTLRLKQSPKHKRNSSGSCWTEL